MQITKLSGAVLLALFLVALAAGLGLATRPSLQAQQPDRRINALPAVEPRQEEARANEAADKKTDEELLAGAWRFTKVRARGGDAALDLVDSILGFDLRMTFTRDGKGTNDLSDPDRTDGMFKYKLSGPGKIDVIDGPDDESQAGIYKFQGDDGLTLCLSLKPGSARPTKFTAEKGDDQVMYVLVRAKSLTAEESAKRKEAIAKMRLGALRRGDTYNLKFIGLAMHHYADENKFLPTHAIYSKDGKTPLLSWRVAILPYLEEVKLYNEFKLDEPWDSEHNKKLIPRMPKSYDSPAAPDKIRKEGKTFYQVFTGPDTVFRGNQKMTFTDIKDDTSSTIVAIEAKNPVIWTRPEDLTLPKEKDKLPAVGGLFKNGITVLFCDGHVQFIRSDPPPAMFRAIVTASGGEVVDFEKLEPKEK